MVMTPFGEVDIPFIQNPFTNQNQGSVPILQKNWAGWAVNPQEQQQLGLGQSSNSTGSTAVDNNPINQTAGVSSGGSGGSGGYAAPSYDPQVLSQYDQAIGTEQNALNRLPTQLGVAQGNIRTQYGQNLNELNSTKDQSQNSYNTSTNQNQQSLRTNKNQISDQASAGLRGLLRTLGAYGAGGSSDAQFVAPQAVATQASQPRAGAGQTFAQNQSGLDTNWNNFLSQDQNSRNKLNDWQTQQLNSAQAQSDQTKQDLLTKLADLTGKRAEYQGGSYTGAAQPFLDQANALSGQIDNLGRLNPTYTGTTPVYNAPSLSSYEVNAGGAPHAQVGNPSALTDQTSPYLSLLLNSQK